MAVGAGNPVVLGACFTRCRGRVFAPRGSADGFFILFLAVHDSRTRLCAAGAACYTWGEPSAPGIRLRWVPLTPNAGAACLHHAVLPAVFLFLLVHFDYRDRIRQSQGRYAPMAGAKRNERLVAGGEGAPRGGVQGARAFAALGRSR